MKNKTNEPLTTSTGHILSEGDYLDSHYLACQPEYEAMLESIGLQSGWRVLDAGCGSGSFLPLMSQLLGPTGRIDAFDLAPENIAIVQAQQTKNLYACPVTTQLGTISKLPYEDDTFDALWCANITQYLTDDELNATLSEFQRVLKPSGLLALKDANNMCLQWQPMAPLLWPRLRQALVDDDNLYIAQVLRGAALPTWVKRSGFKNIRANTIVIERRQPLRDIEKTFLKSMLEVGVRMAETNNYLSEEDKATWKQLGSESSPDFILNHPDFYHSQGHVLVVAENPPKVT